MRVVMQPPPMMAAICAVFPEAATRACLFAWGDTIYNPKRAEISAELFAHEAVHGARQRSGVFGTVEEWWDKYLDSPAFRLAEEVEAHRAEYEAILDRIGRGRNERRRALNYVGLRLIAPLYRWERKISLHAAKRFIAPVDCEPSVAKGRATM